MNLISLREYIRNILKIIEVDERNSPYIRIFLYHYIKKIKMTDVIYNHSSAFLIYSLFVLYHLAVLRRSHIFKLFKKLGKVVHIVDATLCGNISAQHNTVSYSGYCMLDSFIVDVVRQSYSGFFFKER